MRDFVREMHTASGLLDELAAGTTLADAEDQVLAYVREFVPEPGKAPLAGNSVGTDRGLPRPGHARAGGAPALPDRRRVQRSRSSPGAGIPRAYYAAPAKHGGHRALGDIRDSISELRYYRETVFVPAPGPDSASRPGRRGPRSPPAHQLTGGV